MFYSKFRHNLKETWCGSILCFIHVRNPPSYKGLHAVNHLRPYCSPKVLLRNWGRAREASQLFLRPAHSTTSWCPRLRPWPGKWGTRQLQPDISLTRHKTPDEVRLHPGIREASYTMWKQAPFCMILSPSLIKDDSMLRLADPVHLLGSKTSTYGLWWGQINDWSRPRVVWDKCVFLQR